jgi:GAF domain-containing protein
MEFGSFEERELDPELLALLDAIAAQIGHALTRRS